MSTFPAWIQELDGALWLTEDDRNNLKVSYRIKEIIFSQQSDIQHVMILDTYDFGRTLVLDGVVQTTSLDGHIYNEMMAHIPLQIHPQAKKVLIIGGGDCGVAREVVKYPHVEQVDMVEIDQLVVDVCREHLPAVSGQLNDPRVNFIFADGTKFVQDKEQVYDVVIVDSSDPVGPAEELIELDFYRHIHRILKDDGVMVCQSQSPVFQVDLVADISSKVRSLFPIQEVYTAVVPTYPGGMWSFTLGSKQYKRQQSLRETPPETRYFNEGIYRSCFELPTSLKESLKNYQKD